MSYFRNQLEAWLKTIDVKADKVLDIGGGALPVNKRVKSFEVNDYKILDNELEEMKRKPDILMDLNEYQPFDHNSDITIEPLFDVAFCLEVFEYIWNPVQALENINMLMKEGGTLYISFPFIYPQHNPIESDYLRYTKQGAIKLLNETGFKVDDIQSRIATIGDDTLIAFYSQEGMHPAKRDADHRDIGYCIKAIKK